MRRLVGKSSFRSEQSQASYPQEAKCEPKDTGSKATLEDQLSTFLLPQVWRSTRQAGTSGSLDPRLAHQCECGSKVGSIEKVAVITRRAPPLALRVLDTYREVSGVTHLATSRYACRDVCEDSPSFGKQFIAARTHHDLKPPPIWACHVHRDSSVAMQDGGTSSQWLLSWIVLHRNLCVLRGLKNHARLRIDATRHRTRNRAIDSETADDLAGQDASRHNALYDSHVSYISYANV
ncbi:MAG: hypothetical protein WCS01_13085 [bacterium]